MLICNVHCSYKVNTLIRNFFDYKILVEKIEKQQNIIKRIGEKIC